MSSQATTTTKLLALMQSKDAMEAELEAIISELNSGPAPVGLSGNLIDREGFPRNDIDIMRITTLRNRHAMLVTDLKQVLKDIEVGLYELHSETKPLVESTKQQQQQASTSAREEEVAFLRVNSVAFDSPAYVAGLREGDLIYRFGKLREADFAQSHFTGVANEVVEGRPIRIFFRRPGTAAAGGAAKQMTCTLNPQKWEGKGLLGCHLVQS